MAVTTDLALLAEGAATFDPDTFGPFGVRGPDKVAQRFLYALMTPAGSVPGRSGDGSEFLQMISGFASEFDLYAAFATCEPRAAATVKSYEEDTDPDSDRFGYARLAGVAFTAGLLTLTFEIASLDSERPALAIDYPLEV